MKKIKIYNLLIFAVGLSCLSLGIQLVIKSNFGVSVATSPPYVLSMHFKNITFGTWNYMIHGFVLLLLVLIVRRLTVKYLMSFLVSFLFGLAIDFFNAVLSGLQVDGIIGRVGIFVLGTVVIAIGVASLISSNYPILPFDTFVKEVSNAKGIAIGKFKTGFDLVCFTTSLVLSLIFFGEIRGIHVGTFVSAVVLGSMIAKIIGFMNKCIEGRPIFPEDKTSIIMDFDFLNFTKSRNVVEEDQVI